MGAVQPAHSCSLPPSTSDEYRPPWAIVQADSFDCDDCPFCALRRSHSAWLQTEIRRLSSEMRTIETTIPPKFLEDLRERLDCNPLPDSRYTGGVDDVTGSACSKCVEERLEVSRLQRQANQLDSHCKARIDFHRHFACKIEALLIQKRQVEEHLFFKQPIGENPLCPRGDSLSEELHFCAITKVNQCDEDAAEILIRGSPR